MTIEEFRPNRLRPETLALIEQANAFIEEYNGQRLTARQIYYRFVAADLIPNTESSYKKMTSVLTDGRYVGLIDWDAIEDRGREPSEPSDWPHISDAAEQMLRWFRLPRWRGQEYYVELWVEKMALAGVLQPIATRNHITLMVNKGYSSSSAMYASAQRMIAGCGFADDEETEEVYERCLVEQRTPIVLYLGDHDPSGKDMIRDVRDRLVEFGVPGLEVRSIALTTEQVRHYRPPPNPAKLTDSRAAAYIAEHGRQSWELDALPPNELNRIVEEAIAEVIDRDRYNNMIVEETGQRDELRKFLKGMKR